MCCILLRFDDPFGASCSLASVSQAVNSIRARDRYLYELRIIVPIVCRVILYVIYIICKTTL